MFAQYFIKPTILLYIAVTVTIFCSAGPARALTTEVTPRQIPIKLLYHGAHITITGSSDVNDELIVKISTDPQTSHMKYKGKAAGLFWMKMGDMSFENVPTAYLLYSSGDLAKLMPAEEKRIQEGIGFESIRTTATVEMPDESMDRNSWIDQFIKFKKSENLYQINEGTVVRRRVTAGNDYQLELQWPFQGPPGTYNIEVLAVRDGNVVDRNQSSLTIERAGIVEQLSNLAFNHAAVYGIMALVIAMTAGFAVGALFKSDGAH